MRFCCGLIVMLVTTTTASAELFDYVDRTGRQIGTVEVLRSRLFYSDVTGVVYSYTRERSYDSPDGRYVGYYNYELNRAVQFPRSGRGRMLSADFDDIRPTFTLTDGAVRRRVDTSVPLDPRLRRVPIGPLLPGSGYDDHHFGGAPYGSSYVPPVLDRAPYRNPRYSHTPRSVLLDSRVVPNPPLPSQMIRLFNSAPRDIQVALVDRENPSGTRTMRMAPKQTIAIELKRDAGARRVSNYRTVTPYGDVENKEVFTNIPPQPLYDVVVHEWKIQSVAIDRTGKSPNRIENINMQGRGIGRFPIDPRFQGEHLDVYRLAKESGNAGAILPIAPEQPDQASQLSPTERAILDLQNRATGR